MNTYVEAWKLGLKAVAIYRDGSKRSRAAQHQEDHRHGRRQRDAVTPRRRGTRRTHRRHSIRENEDLRQEGRNPRPPPHAGHPHVASPTSSRSPATKATSPSACIDDGQPGELFVHMAKEGSTIGGLMDTVGHPHLHGPAIRRAARAAGQEVRLPALRAQRLHQEPGHPHRLQHHRLRLPLARLPVHPRLRGGHLAEPRPARTRRCPRSRRWRSRRSTARSPNWPPPAMAPPRRSRGVGSGGGSTPRSAPPTWASPARTAARTR